MPRLIFLIFLCLGLASLAVEAPPAAPPVPTTTTMPVVAPTPMTPRITYSSVHPDGPYIAMTFDDGPSAANTPRLLDLLSKRHIKATFFLIGENAQQNPALVKRILAEGHEIGNHSWTHPNLATLSDEKVRSELQRTDDAIFEAAGIHPKIMRPPYGSLAIGQRRWVNKLYGYKIILWDVDPLDWKYRNAAHVESEILKGARNGSIILSHDIHSTTIDAMPSTLDQLLAKGFKFLTVSELIAMDKPLPPKPASAAIKKEGAALPSAATSPAPADPAGSNSSTTTR